MVARAGHRALRRGRVSVANQIYLVTFVTWRRTELFRDFHSGALVSSILSRQYAWSGADVLCWCLMPDHWHGLIQLPPSTVLGRCVNSAKSRSAIAVNRRFDRNGQVWNRGYHDHALRKEENLQEVARYIVANPLRAGLVSTIKDYPFWDAVWL